MTLLKRSLIIAAIVLLALMALFLFMALAGEGGGIIEPPTPTILP